MWKFEHCKDWGHSKRRKSDVKRMDLYQVRDCRNVCQSKTQLDMLIWLVLLSKFLSRLVFDHELAKGICKDLSVLNQHCKQALGAGEMLLEFRSVTIFSSPVPLASMLVSKRTLTVRSK